MNSIRRAAQNGLGERNGQKTSRDAADKQTTPRGSLSAFTVMAKEQSPEPENGKHGSCAGHCRGQAYCQFRLSKDGDGQSYEIDTEPLPPITLFGKENGVLSLQDLESIQSVRPSVKVESGRKIGQTMKAQDTNGHHQREQNNRCRQCYRMASGR